MSIAVRISTPNFRYKSKFVNALIEDDEQRIDVVDDDNDDVEPNENNADASDDDNSNDADSVVAESVNEREMSPVEHAAGGTHENDSVNALRLQVELVRAQQAAADYQSIKDAILKGYSLTEATYLKVFMLAMRRTGNTTYQTFF